MDWHRFSADEIIAVLAYWNRPRACPGELPVMMASPGAEAVVLEHRWRQAAPPPRPDAHPRPGRHRRRNTET